MNSDNPIITMCHKKKGRYIFKEVSNIDPHINKVLVEWLISVFNTIEIEQIKYVDNRIIFLMKNILLKFNCRKPGFLQKINAQLIGCCALCLAYKYELDDEYVPSNLVSGIINYTLDSFNLKEYTAMERNIFITLNHNLYMETEYDILLRKLSCILEIKEEKSNYSLLTKNLLYSLSLYFLERLIYYSNKAIISNGVDCCITMAIYIIKELDIFTIIKRMFNPKSFLGKKWGLRMDNLNRKSPIKSSSKSPSSSRKNLKQKCILSIYDTIHNFSMDVCPTLKTSKDSIISNNGMIVNLKTKKMLEDYINNYEQMNSSYIKIKYYDKITEILCKYFINSELFSGILKIGNMDESLINKNDSVI